MTEGNNKTRTNDIPCGFAGAAAKHGRSILTGGYGGRNPEKASPADRWQPFHTWPDMVIKQA